MRLVILNTLFLLLSASLQAQDYLSRAKEIRDIDQAQLFADSLPQVVLGFLHDKMDNEDYQARKDRLVPGDTYESGAYHVVTVAEGSKDIYRFRLLTMTRNNTPNAKSEIQRLKNELDSGKSFEQLFEKHAQNNGPDAEVFGDVGWVDLDFFVPSFKAALLNRKKGDRFIAGDDESGWFNIVDMTHNRKRMKGHYVLLIPNTQTNPYLSNVDHSKNISKLQTKEDLRRYAQKFPGDVQVELLNATSKPELYEEFQIRKELNNKKWLGQIEKDATCYQYMSDTIVNLYSLQYVYLDGSKMTRDARTEAIHDIYDQFYDNVPFDSIVAQYWPDDKGYSTLRNIEGGLLAKDLVSKVSTTTVGQLFVARVGQSYFIGVPLEKPKKVKSFLVLSYPKLKNE